MSRIGNNPVEIADGVTITIDSSNLVTVKGAKGELSLQVNPDITVEQKDSELNVSRPSDHKDHRAMHGLYRTLIHNMVIGVSQGYSKKMEVIGVGYKADTKGQVLELSLGFSHPIMLVFPKEIKIETDTQKGKAPTITVSGIDKQLVGHFAAKIRSFRPPEPYKGKGIKFAGEILRRKAGKAAAKA